MKFSLLHILFFSLSVKKQNLNLEASFIDQIQKRMSLKAVAVLTGEVVRGVVNFEQEVNKKPIIFILI